TNNEVTIGNRDFSFRFEGTLSADGQSMTGRISDWADSGEVVLSRLASAAEAPALRANDRPGSLGEMAGLWEAFPDRQRSDARVRIRIGHDREGNPLALFNN